MTNNPPSTRIYPGEYGYPLKLKARYDNFIGGDWVAPADGEYYQNLDTGDRATTVRSGLFRQKWTSIWHWMPRTK